MCGNRTEEEFFEKARRHYSDMYQKTLSRLDRYLILFSTGGITILLSLLLSLNSHACKIIFIVSILSFIMSIILGLVIITIDFYVVCKIKKLILNESNSLTNNSLKYIENKYEIFNKVQVVIGIIMLLLVSIGTLFGVSVLLEVF